MWPHLKLVVRRLPSMQTIGVGADIPVSGEGFRSMAVNPIFACHLDPCIL